MRVTQRQIQIIMGELQKKRNMIYQQKVEEMMERAVVVEEARNIDRALKSIRPAMRKKLNINGNDYNRILMKIAKDKVRFDQYLDREPIARKIELIAPECKDIKELLERLDIKIDLKRIS